MLSQCLSWSPAERSQEQRLQKKQKEDVINMANKLAFNSIFGLFGLFSLILLIQFVNGTEEQQLWATTLKEKALENKIKDNAKDKASANKTTVTSSSNADTKASSRNNNTKPPDEWSTSPADTILFPETYLSTIKRVLENTTLQSNSSQPITKNGLGKQVPEESKNVKANILPSEDEEDEEAGAKGVKSEKGDKYRSSNMTVHQCSKAVDLIFLLDSSESVKYENWNQVTKFVKHLCDRFSLSLTRLAIIRYDSEAEIALPLTHFPDALSRDLAIDNIYYKTGGTRTDVALEKCIELIHSSEKRKASQVMILVTDGPSNKLEINRNNFVEGKDLVHAPSQLLKDEGVALFAIGIEPDSQTPKERNEMKEELQVIASEPSKSHVFLADGYRELERKVNDISNAACVVNGGWSLWSEYSPCSVTCGSGTKVRMRTCTNPVPENNGAECTGVRVETQSCDMGPCSGLSTQVGQMLKLYTGGNMVLPMQPQNANGQQNVLEENHLDLKKSACPGGYEEIPVQDEQLSASTFFVENKTSPESDKEYAPFNSRLNNAVYKGSWCAGPNVTMPTEAENQFLQIDLKKTEIIGMVATQGSHTMDKWVKRYYVRYSEDGTHWNSYNNKTALDGNTDRNSIVKNNLSPPIKARYIQINPKEWNNDSSHNASPDICLRAALYRCIVKEQQKRNRIPEARRHKTEHRHRKNGSSEKRSPLNVSIGAKRILSKLRKMAKHIVKKMKNRVGPAPLG